MGEGSLSTSTKVALVGLSGSGKTSVARQLAKRLDLPCVDLDSEVEARTGLSLVEIFEQRGEAGFRLLEAEALKRALKGDPCVIATGGGAPCQPGAMDALLEAALVVWLDAGLAVLERRLSGSEDRPLLAQGELLDRLEGQERDRRPVYARAHLRVPADRGDVASVVARIIAHLEVDGE